MPIYEYKCECGRTFDHYIRSFKQAACKKVVPNANRCACPSCGKYALRVVVTEDMHLYSYSFNPVKMIADLKAVPDPGFDGKTMVNGGKNYGVVAPLDISAERRSVPDGEVDYILDSMIDCGCSFCTEAAGKAEA